MSISLSNGAGAALAALEAVLGWQASLLPGSFRGVPFYVNSAQNNGGRRKVEKIFPYRDTAYVEDMGKQPRSYTIKCFVVGADYMLIRDALVSACEDYTDPGTFVHPWLGQMTASAGKIVWSEHKDAGGYCEFTIPFYPDGPQPSPISITDTASALLGNVVSLLPFISVAYAAIPLAAVSPAALLGQLSTALLALPPGSIGGLQSLVSAVDLTPDDLAGTAAAVQAVFQAVADQLIAANAAPAVADDPVAGQSFTLASPADVSGGLAGLVSWGADLPAITLPGDAGTALAAQQGALVAMAQGNAVAALAQVYAAYDWPYADEASDARTQLTPLLDTQIEAAADAGQDDLYRGWVSFSTGILSDLIARAQSLPDLVTYSRPSSLPSIVLAQILYADPTRAEQLEQLNDVPHPLFMPAAGLALSQ